MEWNENKVHEKSWKVGGLQCIISLEGHTFPIDIVAGLPCIKMNPPTDAELALPQVHLTRGEPWNPRV